jgi:hypothetical protein
MRSQLPLTVREWRRRLLLDFLTERVIRTPGQDAVGQHWIKTYLTAPPLLCATVPDE